MPDRVTDRLYSWASDIDPGAIQQALKASRLPIIAGHVALMPDAHVGIGATVGSVIPTENAVIPAAVGVDIGCGMIAARLDLTAEQLPDGLDTYLRAIEQNIPAGVGRGHQLSSKAADVFMQVHPNPRLTDKQRTTAATQFGSLGSGNHFFEVCLDEDDRVWVVLHSGSRGIGNQLAQGHINAAKSRIQLDNLKLEDPNLAYLEQGTAAFEDYISDMLWAQKYAMQNRAAMMLIALREFGAWLGRPVEPVETINCHHNFTQQEEHGGRMLWITRKGAIKADRGDLGVIPGSMGTRSYIVEGKGNALSWNSCSHGAGRRRSRSAAKKEFTTDQLTELMQGKVWQSENAAALLDEIPSAYKDIDQVMADQTDLVQVRAVLRQIMNYKGV